jgi:hypothetical protein
MTVDVHRKSVQNQAPSSYDLVRQALTRTPIVGSMYPRAHSGQVDEKASRGHRAPRGDCYYLASTVQDSTLCRSVGDRHCLRRWRYGSAVGRVIDDVRSLFAYLTLLPSCRDMDAAHPIRNTVAILALCYCYGGSVSGWSGRVSTQERMCLLTRIYRA